MEVQIRNWHKRNVRAAKLLKGSLTIGGGPGVGHGVPYVQLHLHELDDVDNSVRRIYITIRDAQVVDNLIASLVGTRARAFGAPQEKA